MSNLVDYAGLFPPAKLPLETAARNYARYRRGSNAWALARFVCPAAQLGQLNSLANSLDGGTTQRWPISVLGSSSHDQATFHEKNLIDCEHMRAAHAAAGATLLMDAMETKIPSPTQASKPSSSVTDDMARWSQTWLAVAESQGLLRFTVFLELPAGDGWSRDVEKLASVLAAHNRERKTQPCVLQFGLKIRTGGIKAAMIPSISDVATFILQCRKHSVPFKATAGLHHPIRRHAPEVSAKMHGFLNVFGAAVLAYTNDLSVCELQALLSEESSAPFVFSGEGLAWRDFKASMAQIEAARERFAMSFGSCSFTEPIADMQQLGLWPKHTET